MFSQTQKQFIEEGDLAIVWLGKGKLTPIVLNSTETLHNQFGAYPHSELIGKRYGQQIASSSKQGFIYLLHPTPELWTLALPHRTQIVYTPDVSAIVQKLRIVEGSRVIEAGTGSGSMTHALSRTIGPTGKLYTFEYHETRYQTALKEFTDHKMMEDVGGNTVLTHRDVCKQGFVLKESSPEDIHSVFLDLPAPWEAIEHLGPCLRKNGGTRICCFSPCMEQVQRTVQSLRENKWTEIQMIRLDHKLWMARKTRDMDIEEALDRLRFVKRKRLDGLERRRQRQLQENNTADDDSSETQTTVVEEPRAPSPTLPATNKRIREGDEAYNWINVCKLESEVKSHTSYLLFALHLPSANEQNTAEVVSAEKESD
ncbi:tRNA methyltransferase complex catalytic subunit Cpd1 [Schizosaccharomyces japonicus yFS275]|uniref:tRNA (adenine(58)-N(1))-methyltransferase catalytic subunit TRM61 n=1 Tax=Schizosaccharomyces japonicus (strain yFS275 / FY16936) TaxID=402676 RepID=B6K2B8_SCHJY|nr:tRNA methyltransferase complex catalytic subunit Cpd1 [Schizosaccharomyces japonicus yFS275]EEB07299.1 tRNA methyltransferase complex catalytic subunit Cpd1 [Schizosaccharomyces japonicus yFS275]